MLKTLRSIICLLLLALLCIACTEKEDSNAIKVGTISGPETTLVEVAKDVAKKQYQLNIKIVEFTDYNMPNIALDDGSIDANIFQHGPYLHAAKAAHGYKLSAIAKTFIYPMAIYSKKIKSLAELKDKSVVAIPNDPSNEARALLLLQKAGIIRLDPKKGINATSADIIANP